jgi:phosphoglycerate dehydrogenase-like enzyme
VAQLCGCLGMRVLAWTRNPTPERLADAGASYMPLEQLVAEADFVTLHLAHSPDTDSIISDALLRRMQPSSFLINTARAELVDEEALAGALRDGRIAGAAIDVFTREPLPPENMWRTLPNVILTPHVGFRTPEASGRSMRMALENLIDLFGGQPRNVVNEAEIGHFRR